MNIYYAGVGSRETPKEVLNYFSKLASLLAQFKAMWTETTSQK